MTGVTAEIAKRPVGRPRKPGRRPVISMRVHFDAYEKLRVLAEDRRIPISEEAASRIAQSIALDELRASLPDAVRMAGNLREAALWIEMASQTPTDLERKLFSMLLIITPWAERGGQEGSTEICRAAYALLLEAEQSREFAP